MRIINLKEKRNIETSLKSINTTITSNQLNSISTIDSPLSKNDIKNNNNTLNQFKRNKQNKSMISGSGKETCSNSFVEIINYDAELQNLNKNKENLITNQLHELQNMKDNFSNLKHQKLEEIKEDFNENINNFNSENKIIKDHLTSEIRLLNCESQIKQKTFIEKK